MTIRTSTALAAALLIAGAASARSEFYYRNVNPGAQGMQSPSTGSGGTKPVDQTPTPPAEETGPLRLTLSPAGAVVASYKADTNAVFHAAGGCAGPKSFRLLTPSASVLSGLGLRAAQSGNDYVISGRLNLVGAGSQYNLSVAVRDSCSASQQIDTDLHLNFDSVDDDPPWNLYVNAGAVQAGQPYAFGPEIRGTASSDAVDTRGFTYTLETLDPVNRPIPSWMRLSDPSTGVISGTAPGEIKTYGPFYVTAKAPNGGFSQSADFTLSVTGGFTFTGLDGTGATAVTLPGGEARSLTFTGTGGCSVNRYFGNDSDYPLPTGMSLTDTNDRWVISGTPTVGGTWPVRLSFLDYACGAPQFFFVNLTVTGVPESVLAFFGEPQVSPIYVNGRYPGFVTAYVDTTGPGWKTTTCSLANLDGSPADVPWATPYPSYNWQCALTFAPTDEALVGSYTWRLRATTDSRGSVLSDPVTVTVSPKSAEPAPDPDE